MGIGDYIHECIPRPVIIAGNFNAKSPMWGSPTGNLWGRLVEKWAEQLGLVLLNSDGSSTVVRSRGESAVDLTWATPAAARLAQNWRVAEDLETSDHLYIEMEVFSAPREFLS